MEGSGDERDVLEWTTGSTLGVGAEESMKGIFVVVEKDMESTRWTYHFLLDVQMKGSRGIAERILMRLGPRGAEIVAVLHGGHGGFLHSTLQNVDGERCWRLSHTKLIKYWE